MRVKQWQGESQMSDQENPLPDEAPEIPIDPLTSPGWLFQEEDDVFLAPAPENFFSEFTTVSRVNDVEQKPIEEPTVIEEVQTEVVQKVQVAIVEDPDEVVSPAQALEEARRRIAAMRASLQVNLNQVATSFEHPIFTVQENEQSNQHTVEVETEHQALTVDTQEKRSEVQQTSFESEQTPSENFQTAAQHRTAPQTHIYIPIETQLQPEPEQQVAQQDHSLELMIMRDEIKDLRDRLDASQKLIEDLMHRLANLAELALKRQM